MLWQQWIANISCLIRSVRSSCTRKRSRLPRRNKTNPFSVYGARSFASPLAKGKMKVRVPCSKVASFKNGNFSFRLLLLCSSAREETVSVRVRAKTTTEHVHQKPGACLHNAAGRCELVFLSDAHCRQETAINYSISWQTMSPLIDPNRIPSPRTHYAIDRTAITCATGEPSLHPRHRLSRVSA